MQNKSRFKLKHIFLLYKMVLFFVLFSLVQIFLTQVTASLNRELEWLSVCPGGDSKKYIIHDTAQCQKGFYFKSPFKDLCVCGNGVWKMSSDVCGKAWIVDAEDGDCFEMPEAFGIRWIQYLGHAHAPKKEFNFVTDPTLSYVVPMSDSSFSDAGYYSVVTINPRRAFSDCNNEICYKAGKVIDESYHPGEPLPRVMWADIPKDQGMYAAAQCVPNPTVDAQYFPKGIPRRGSYYNLHQDNAEFFLRYAPSDKCQKRCSPDFSNMSFDDTIWSDGRIAAGHGILDMTQISNPAAFANLTSLNLTEDANITNANTTNAFPFPIPKKPVVCKLPPLLNITDKRKKNLAAQTQRMAEAHFSAVILGKRAPLIVMPEFEYLRSGRLVFEKVCPAAEVAPTLLKSLLVLFRVAVNESLTKAPYEHLGDAEEDARLKTSLESCLTAAGSKPFKVSYNSSQCPPLFDGFFLDRKTPGPMPMNPNVPCEVAHVSGLDYPIEAAWKLVMFTHYFCAQHFNVTAFDHSRLEYKLRQLFNRDIITRWFHPGLAGKVFQHIFSDYNLDKFMSGMDRCVAGAKYISPYINWIKRPKFEGGIQQKADAKKGAPDVQILKGLGKCLMESDQVKQIGQGRCQPDDIKPPTCKDWSGQPEPDILQSKKKTQA